MSRTDPKMLLRIPAAVLEAIRESASKNHRSMNSEAVYQLAKAYGITLGGDLEQFVQFKFRIRSSDFNELSEAAMQNDRSISAELLRRVRAARHADYFADIERLARTDPAGPKDCPP